MTDDYRQAEARSRLTIDPKEIDWGPPKSRPDDWPDDPAVRRFTEWLKSLIPEEEWAERRLAHFFAMYGAGMPVARERRPDMPFLFNAGEDRGGWYLFLAESWIDHIGDYEPAQGSRVIPLFQMLGAHFDLLMQIEGVEEHARRSSSATPSPQMGRFSSSLSPWLTSAPVGPPFGSSKSAKTPRRQTSS